jgi:hypothetical protein
MRSSWSTWSFRAAFGAAALLTQFSCQQTPTPVAVRTFERAQRMDAICLESKEGALPEPRPLSECAILSRAQDGSGLSKRVYAVVTQSLRGELAVVDVSSAGVLDTDRATPGINFLPVGLLPVDVAAAPDSRMVFVATAEVNKPAIYGLPSQRLLGDRAPVVRDIGLNAWPSCKLPETPLSISVMPRPEVGPLAYDLVMVTAGDREHVAKLVVIDPAPFLRGAGVEAGDPKLAPGLSQACPIKSAVELAKQVPAVAPRGPAYGDGVPFGSVSTPVVPQGFGTCAAGPTPVSSTQTLALPTEAQPRATAAVTSGSDVFVADAELPVIHWFDLSGGVVREIPSLLLSRERDPSRTVHARSLAVSPPTRDRKRYLYAVDDKDGSLILFDITDPATSPRSPLLRPHPEVNPFQEVDRLAFGAPVAHVAFAQHDWPVLTTSKAALSGLLCTPQDGEAGRLYGEDAATDIGAGLGPRRLRGVFAFAVLTNGQLATIDVDDWDASCRRPTDMSASVAPVSSVVGTMPNKPSDPYGYPQTPAASGEQFFPVSAPFRPRSSEQIKNDTTRGNRIPRLDSAIQLVAKDGALETLLGAGSDQNPILVATNDNLRQVARDPNNLAIADIRMSFETPEVHLSQDWSVAYEGALPTVDPESFALNIESDDDEQSLLLRRASAGFCGRGIEDQRIGAARAQAIKAQLVRRAGVTPEGAAATALSADLGRTMGDYVQIASELLPSNDPYWAEGRSCWGGVTSAKDRYDTCQAVFGNAADEQVDRDFPILEATDETLRVSRFGYDDPSAKTVGNRYIGIKETSNQSPLRLARCCFHDQVRVRVRSGRQWLATGSVSGFLRHVVRAPDGNCVLSCAAKDALLNARVPSIPRFGPASKADPRADAPSRDDVLAFRNPFFSFAIFDERVLTAKAPRARRGLAFRFTTRGEFIPQSIPISSGGVNVLPQSIRYVEALGQIAVVDAVAQGLVLIDLDNVGFARTPFF